VKLADHLPATLQITRGYCRTCDIVGVMVLHPESLTEPLTCNKGHLLEVGVPGLDVTPHVGDEPEDIV